MFQLKEKGLEMTDDVFSWLCRIETRLSAIEERLVGRDDVLVSCSEASRLLGKTRTTISAMIREKRLNKVTIGESTGIRLSDIMAIKSS